MAKKPIALRDVVCWFAIRAAAAAICERFSRGGDRNKLQTAKTYPVKLRVTGTAAGKPIDREIKGRLVRDQDKKTSTAPGGRDLLAEAIAATPKAERVALVKRLKRGPTNTSEEARAAADSIIEARRVPGTRSGDVRLVAD